MLELLTGLTGSCPSCQARSHDCPSYALSVTSSSIVALWTLPVVVLTCSDYKVGDMNVMTHCYSHHNQMATKSTQCLSCLTSARERMPGCMWSWALREPSNSTPKLFSKAAPEAHHSAVAKLEAAKASKRSWEELCEWEERCREGFDFSPGAVEIQRPVRDTEALVGDHQP